MQPLDIIVTEDDVKFLRPMTRILERQGHHVRSTTRGDETVVLYRQKPCDVLILDENLVNIVDDEPHFTYGSEAYWTLQKEQGDKMPLTIIISSERNIHLKYQHAKNISYFPKPFQISELLDHIAYRLAHRSAAVTPPEQQQKDNL